MKVINTFSTNINNLKQIDILIWTASLINYKKLGYNLKLFCEEKDFEFLDKYFLKELYDEIDINLFKNNEKLNQVNLDKFWASRKFEALNYEYNILKEDCIYSDTDIIMRTKFDLSGDALVWSPEDWAEDINVYINWKLMSKPKRYKLPKYIKNTKFAYNAGILCFKNINIFNQWYNEYYKFAINNPCVLKDITDDFNNIFMCNAEQRILKAILVKNKQNVKFIMNKKEKGWSKQGSHYFFFKKSWCHINNEEFKPKDFVKGMLNCTVKECLEIIHSVSDEVYQFWLNKLNLKSSDEIDIDNNIFPINEYA